MADHFYGVTVPGAKLGDVSIGTATTSKKVELRVEDGVSGNNKTEVLKALDAIRAYIQTDAEPA